MRRFVAVSALGVLAAGLPTPGHAGGRGALADPAVAEGVPPPGLEVRRGEELEVVIEAEFIRPTLAAAS